MSRFIEGEQRTQSVLFPEQLEDWITEDNPVRAIDSFVDVLDRRELGFAGAQPAATGRPAYHPATLLKIYLYGYLNRIQSSRRLERDAQRNVGLVWLTGRPGWRCSRSTPDVVTRKSVDFAGSGKWRCRNSTPPCSSSRAVA